MEGQHEIITPVFKSKQASNASHQFVPKPAAKLTVNDIEMTIFKGAHSSLATELAKVIIRYAH